jgi:hypothetical protein
MCGEDNSHNVSATLFLVTAVYDIFKIPGNIFFKFLLFHIVFRYLAVSLDIISFVKGYLRYTSLWCVSVIDNMEGSLCVL